MPDIPVIGLIILLVVAIYLWIRLNASKQVALGQREKLDELRQQNVSLQGDVQKQTALVQKQSAILVQVQTQNSSLQEWGEKQREAIAQLQIQVERLNQTSREQLLQAQNQLTSRIQEQAERYSQLDLEKSKQAQEEIALRLREQSERFALVESELSKQIEQLHARALNIAQEQFNQWRVKEVQAIREAITKEQQEAALRDALANFEQWRADEEQKIRADAVQRSQAVTRGKITEHLVPYLPEFDNYNPKDARFMGSPIDFVIFDGLNEGSGEVREVIFVEVKTRNSVLTPRERQVEKAIRERRVSWRVMRVQDTREPTIPSLFEIEIDRGASREIHVHQ